MLNEQCPESSVYQAPAFMRKQRDASVLLLVLLQPVYYFVQDCSFPQNHQFPEDIPITHSPSLSLSHTHYGCNIIYIHTHS